MWRIVELSNSTFLVRHLFWFLGLGAYLGKRDGTRWVNPWIAEDDCLYATIDEARAVIKKYGKKTKYQLEKPLVIKVHRP